MTIEDNEYHHREKVMIIKGYKIEPKSNLRNADLRQADLSDAKLIGANLNGADLSGANLLFADLRGANLSGASIIDAGLDFRGYRFIARAGDVPMIFAGCRWFNLAEAKSHWNESNDEFGQTLKLDYLIREMERRGWINE